MLKWKIYYENGSTFSNEDGTFNEAPTFGVLSIACDDGQWISGDLLGLIQYLQKLGLVKIGIHADNEVYSKVLHGARHDTEFSPDRVILEGDTYYMFKGHILK